MKDNLLDHDASCAHRLARRSSSIVFRYSLTNGPNVSVMTARGGGAGTVAIAKLSSRKTSCRCSGRRGSFDSVKALTIYPHRLSERVSDKCVTVTALLGLLRVFPTLRSVITQHRRGYVLTGRLAPNLFEYVLYRAERCHMRSAVT